MDAELPRYRCHKDVRAIKIERIDSECATDGTRMLFVEQPFAPMVVTSEWMARHRPETGGYLVVYPDGYMSWSPARAFEDSYTRVTS